MIIKSLAMVLKIAIYIIVYSIIIGLVLIIVALSLLILITNNKFFAYLAKIFVYFIRIITYMIIIFIFKICNQTKVEGYKNIPEIFGFPFFSEHETLIDSGLIAYAIMSIGDVLFRQRKIPVNFPEMKNFSFNLVLRTIFAALKTKPISRNGAGITKIEENANLFSQTLLDKENVVIFYTATRKNSGKKQNCKIGSIITIMKVRPPYFVPIRLIGIQQIMPIEYGSRINLKINLGKKGRIIFGKPVYLENFYQQHAEIFKEAYSWEKALELYPELAKIIEESTARLG